jgi:hypothetical protein
MAYVADKTSLQIIDVSNPHEPIIIGVALQGEDVESVVVQGGRAYARTLLAGISVVDIDEPAFPVRLGQFRNADVAMVEDVIISGSTLVLSSSEAARVPRCSAYWA